MKLLCTVVEMKLNHQEDPAEHEDGSLRSHDNTDFREGLICVLRIADENESLPEPSLELQQVDTIGMNIIDSILNKRRIGDLGLYGFQQVMYRLVFSRLNVFSFDVCHFREIVEPQL